MRDIGRDLAVPLTVIGWAAFKCRKNNHVFSVALTVEHMLVIIRGGKPSDFCAMDFRAENPMFHGLHHCVETSLHRVERAIAANGDAFSGPTPLAQIPHP